jgi:alpha-ketoglutarate-dependent 2,4-dichlorophenoxyacetate dioxygenase
VNGLPDDEAQQLVDDLIGFCTQPERVYTHAWQPGDVLVWDERATLHRGRPWPYDEERTLASICVSVTATDGVDSVRVDDAG